RDEADTEVDIQAAGGSSHTITCAKYTSHPGGAPSFTAVGLYYDVSIDSVAGVDSVKIRFYYTDADIAGFVESSLRAYWWTGTTWTLCSPQALYTEAVDGYSGYIEVGPILAAGTTPTLNQLVGTPFGVGGKTPAPPPAAKYLEVELRLSSLEVDVSDGPKTIHVTADASTSDGASAYITYMWSVSGGELNVEQDRFVEASSVEWILTRVGGYSITCVARSQGYSDGEDTASVTAIPEMDLPLRALCGTLILLYILLWKIRWRLPVNTSSTRSSPVLAKAQI
ncbi:hypothetical protein KEJ44_08560, partial [Candidatus Bathyarchaeota archaeon]|nr:hypothetical protein [Candidatus Bathyarchaeota archaeon]